MNTAVVIAALVFAGMILLGAGVFYSYNFFRDKSRLTEKIKRGSGGSKYEDTILSRAGHKAKGGFFVAYLFDIINSLGNAIKPKDNEDLSNIGDYLLRAGFQKKNTIVFFYGLKAILTILLPACLFFLKAVIIKAGPSINFMTYSVLLALLGFYLPNICLKILTDRRKQKIFEGFPDALDMIVVCVEAGMGLDSAIYRTGEEMKLKNRVISQEFRLLSLELRAGKQRSDALRSLAKRIDLEDVTGLISLLIQTDRFGTSIAQSLRVYSDSMRIKRNQMADELAAKLPVKLVFPLVLFIFPALFVTLVGPAAIKIYRSLLPALGGLSQ